MSRRGSPARPGVLSSARVRPLLGRRGLLHVTQPPHAGLGHGFRGSPRSSGGRPGSRRARWPARSCAAKVISPPARTSAAPASAAALKRAAVGQRRIWTRTSGARVCAPCRRRGDGSRGRRGRPGVDVQPPTEVSDVTRSQSLRRACPRGGARAGPNFGSTSARSSASPCVPVPWRSGTITTFLRGPRTSAGPAPRASSGQSPGATLTVALSRAGVRRHSRERRGIDRPRLVCHDDQGRLPPRSASSSDTRQELDLGRREELCQRRSAHRSRPARPARTSAPRCRSVDAQDAGLVKSLHRQDRCGRARRGANPMPAPARSRATRGTRARAAFRRLSAGCDSKRTMPDSTSAGQ